MPERTLIPAEILDSTFVRTIDHHPELSSTNDRVRQLGPEVALAALVITDRQTSGRGRGRNSWWSAEGALTFSVVLSSEELGLPAERRSLVALATGLAVRGAIAQTHPGLEVGLKWPNDVLLAGRKVCGILVEETAGRIVIGIGLNANNVLTNAPAEIRSVGTSLRDELGELVDIRTILIRVLIGLEEEIERLHHVDDRIDRRWSRYCLLTDRFVSLRVHERRIQGTCRGIDGGGALLVQTSTGLERCLSAVVESYR